MARVSTRAILFHVKPVWRRVAEYAGLEVGPEQTDMMERFGSWLVSEGRRGGGIGPGEVDKIDRRHLADSLLFATEFPESVAEVWDLGSGVGLPGIPLAIAMPETSFLLLDRSGRRVDLMRRAIRVLGLENCEVRQAEIAELHGQVGVLVSRGSLPPGEMAEVAKRHLGDDGVAVLAGSWRERPDPPGWSTVEIPSYVLDQPVWLLIMRRE
jgi:16S rRNA (guanine527-N7)-methyltransferase